MPIFIFEETMKAIIPVKYSSSRVPMKNFKEFYSDDSLYDITVQKLLRVLDPEDIYVSCENEVVKHQAEKRYGINFILRDKRLADNDTPFYDVFNGVCDQVEGNDDIAWCQVIDPLFNDYQQCFDTWNNGYEYLQCGVWSRRNVKRDHDSLVVVYPHKDYYLNENYEPEGFGFGAWHKKSQLLPRKYQLTFTLSILKRETIKQHGYYVGANPYWHHAHNPRVDIDTQGDFEMAQAIYAYFQNRQIGA